MADTVVHITGVGRDSPLDSAICPAPGFSCSLHGGSGGRVCLQLTTPLSAAVLMFIKRPISNHTTQKSTGNGGKSVRVGNSTFPSMSGEFCRLTRRPFLQI